MTAHVAFVSPQAAVMVAVFAIFGSLDAIEMKMMGVGLAALWPELLILAGYAGALFTTGYLLFTKRPST